VNYAYDDAHGTKTGQESKASQSRYEGKEYAIRVVYREKRLHLAFPESQQVGKKSGEK
jgi:hypothetical protein